MVQGDSYILKVVIRKGNEAITSSNCAGVKILLGKNVYSTTDETCWYDSTDSCWKFTLTQAQSIALPENAPYQVQVKIGTSIINSVEKYVHIEHGNIKEVWNAN